MSYKVLEFDKLLKINLKRKIGLCWGGFDFIHAGHILHFKFAKENCNTLIVAINPDAAFPDKGRGRPFFNEELRTEIIGSIIYVDYVIVYRGPFLDENLSTGIIHGKIQKTPFIPVEIFNKIKPDVYFKGIEYKDKIIPELTLIKQYGGEIIYGPKENVFSSSQLLKKNNL